MEASSGYRLTGPLLAALLAVVWLPAQAQVVPVVRGGTLACAGNLWTDEREIEAHVTNFIFLNAGNQDISIDRVLVTDANGQVRCDYPSVDAFPAEFKPILPKRQNTTLSVLDMEACTNPVVPLAQEERPLQVLVTWASVSKAYTPELVGYTSYRTRSLENAGATTAIDNTRCLTLGVVR